MCFNSLRLFEQALTLNAQASLKIVKVLETAVGDEFITKRPKMFSGL
jgi:hypothetical protein